MKRAAEQLRSLERFHEVLTVSTIAEEIVSVNVGEKATEALKIMEERHFDVLGLQEGDTIIGYVEASDLQSKDHLAESVCGIFCKGWNGANLVNESCSLAECMAKLKEVRRLFVHTSGLVHGIVTRADMHKQPIRMLLFSVVSLLEMALLSLIRETYPEERRWKPLLSGPRLDAAEELLRKRTDAAIDIHLLDCLQLVDKGTILRKTQHLRASLGFESNGKCEKFFGRLDGVRNALAHGGALQDDPKLTRAMVVDTFETASGVLGRSIRLLEEQEENARIRAEA